MSEAKIYTLFSSSKGNCAYIKHGRDEFLIDCGASARAIENALAMVGSSLADIKAIFITHEHSDHIRGLSTVCKYFGTPVYAPSSSLCYIDSHIACAADLRELKSGCAVELFDSAVCPVATPHDALSSVGFRIRVGNEIIGYYTDIGHLSEGVLRGLAGCRRVVIESNHDIEMLKNGRYPYSLKQRILGDRGHLSNRACASLLPHLARHGTESFVLAHLSEENNRPETAFRESFVALLEKGFTVNGERITDAPEPDCVGEIKELRLRVASPCGITELK
ncbi:MAG: MBL fold metallo-hydrolase [Clostridia bacterium]|nr:MBL fold metallo-hydrolase [Clostridia bacterium]